MSTTDTAARTPRPTRREADTSSVLFDAPGPKARVRHRLIAVAGATLMVLTGVLTPRSAARALNWNILAIIAGSVGLGTIVVKSGLGERISDAILTLSAGNTALVVVVFVLGTTVLTNVVTNSAAAAINLARPRRLPESSISVCNPALL